MKFCTKCGAELNDEEVVCPKCGAQVDGGAPVVEGKNSMAVAGFICSFFIPLLGWIFGGIGLKKSKALNGKGKGLSVAAIVIATINFILNFVIILGSLGAE